MVIVKQLYEYAANKGHMPSKERLEELVVIESFNNNSANAPAEFNIKKTEPKNLPLKEEKKYVTSCRQTELPIFYIGSDKVGQMGHYNVGSLFSVQNLYKLPNTNTTHQLKNCKSFNISFQSSLSNSFLSHSLIHNSSSPANLSNTVNNR